MVAGVPFVLCFHHCRCRLLSGGFSFPEYGLSVLYCYHGMVCGCSHVLCFSSGGCHGL